MIIAFHSSDHKTGCSSLSRCIAQQLSIQNPEKKVLLLHCEGRSEDNLYPCVQESMERILPYLSKCSPDLDEITEKSRFKENFHIIEGLHSLGSGATIHPNTGAAFLRSLKERFEIIICDTGSEIDQGLPLGCLLEADKVYMVLSQKETTLRRFEWLKMLYEKLQLPIKAYVLCRYRKKGLYTEKEIIKRLGIPKENLFIVRESPFGEIAEAKGECLLNFKDNNFSSDIKYLLQSIEV